LSKVSDKAEKAGIVDKIKGYVRLARPKQWIKNLFVFAALIFAKHVFDVDYFTKFCWPFYAFA